MIIRTVHNKDNPYFVLNRTAADDERLSFKAVGIHTYLMSKPDHWTIRETDLANRHAEGTSAVRSGLKELRDAGYLETVFVRDDRGRIISKEAAIYEVPIVRVIHNVGNPQNGVIHKMDNPQNGVIADIVSSDLLENKELLETADDDDGAVSFADVVKAYENNIGMFTQMTSESVQADFDEYGGQWLLDAMKIAVDANVRKWNYVAGILKRWAVDGKQQKPDEQKPAEVALPAAEMDGIF